MVCLTCHGELYADRRSVADMAQRGYRGGRVTCAQGCTSIWLFERLVPETIPDHKPIKIVLCVDCRIEVRTHNFGTKRCDDCRYQKHLREGRAAWKRYKERRIA